MRHFLALSVLFCCFLASIDGGAGAFIPSREDVPKYIAQLKSGQPKDRVHAAEMLGKRGRINVKDVKDAIEPLKNALQKDSSTEVRKAAAQALGSIAPDPTTTVPLLADALKTKDYGLRMAAVSALAGYGPEAKSAVPALKELQKELNDKKNSKIIGAAIQAISGKKKG